MLRRKRLYHIAAQYWSLCGREFHTAWSKRAGGYSRHGQLSSSKMGSPMWTWNIDRFLQRWIDCRFLLQGVAWVCLSRWNQGYPQVEQLENSMVSRVVSKSGTVYILFDIIVDIACNAEQVSKPSHRVIHTPFSSMSHQCSVVCMVQYGLSI